MTDQMLFKQCKFRPEQLDAMRTLYWKYFDPKMSNNWDGKGDFAFWSGGIAERGFISGQGVDRDHSNPGFTCIEAQDDPLWKEHFSDLLPYMCSAAIITKIPPKYYMPAHIDRKWRPHAIYFPISGTENCHSYYYADADPEYFRTSNSIIGLGHPMRVIDTYRVHDNAILTNVRVMHSVENKGDVTRIAFGWNFAHYAMPFEKCYEILDKLGYV